MTILPRSRFALLAMVALVGASPFGALAEVPVGENILLNGRFECDQTDLPLGWTFFPPKMLQPEWSPSRGPNGIPSFKLAAAEGVSGDERTIRQTNIRLSPKGRFRLSCQVRTGGFTGRGFIIVCNAFWKASRGIKNLPADTAGEWRKLEVEFDAFESADGLYFLCIGASAFTGSLEVADLSLEPLDDLAAKGTDRAVLSPYAVGPRIVPWAPLGTIPEDRREVEFRFLGKLPSGTEADYDMALSVDGAEIGRQRINPAINRFKLPADASSGELAVRLVRRSDGSNVVSRCYRYQVVKSPSAGNLAKHVRLNNLVTEVLREKIAGTAARGTFGLRRRGWVLIALKTSAPDGWRVSLDGHPVLNAAYPRHETFREIESGDHELNAEGVRTGDQLMVRSIPEIFNYCPYDPAVRENGPYDWAYQERRVNFAVTTHNGGLVPPEARDWFRKRGYHWVANMHSHGLKDADDLLLRFEQNEKLKDPVYDGMSLDEQFWGRDEQNAWFMEALRRYDVAAKPEKPFYTWITGGKPLNGVCDADMIATCIGASLGRSKLLIESYCRTKPTLAEAEVHLSDYIRDQAKRLRATYPNGMGSVGMVFGNFNQMPVLTLQSHPEVDYRHYLDMQLNIVANDPAFEGLSTVGYWGSDYSDCELLPWCFELMRHYCVKGSREMLSDRYGLSYCPGHVRNGDFRKGLGSWQARGDVKASAYKGLGQKTEGRWGGDGAVGDAFAEFARGDRPNRLSQTVTGLVPGKRYYLQFVTFDVNDLRAQKVEGRPFGLTASFASGAQVDPSRSWVHVDRRKKGRYATNDGRAAPNVHHVVFQAKSETAELVFSDQGAKPGDCLGLNAVGIYLSLR